MAICNTDTTMKVFSDYSLLSHNTFGMDVKARAFVEYGSVGELQSLVREGVLREPFFHIGGGSNLLFTKDYEGTILHSGIHGTEVSVGERVRVKVGAAMVWDDFVALAVDSGWYGVENLSLIPGEVGASAVQNIGAYGVEAKDVIADVECVDLRTGEVRLFSNAECKYGYRDSIFKGELRGRYAVTHVTYELHREPRLHLEYGNIRDFLPQDSPEPTPAGVRQAIINIRNSKLPDPKRLGNAGSFFMNPVVSETQFSALMGKYPGIPHYSVPGGVKIPAGWLIEQSGMKGYSCGRAAVYDKQALVIVNTGGASPAEILSLSEMVKRSVMEKFGIAIETEVNFI